MSIAEKPIHAELVHPALAIFDHTGQPLFLGRIKRTASLAQRLVLFARDRGCARPGCDHGAFGAEVHHLIEWAAGGPTDVPNLTIACKRDHRHVTDSAASLRTWMGPDGNGRRDSPSFPTRPRALGKGRYRCVDAALT